MIEDISYDIIKGILFVIIIFLFLIALFCPLIDMNNRIENLQEKVNIYHSSFCNECGKKI